MTTLDASICWAVLAPLSVAKLQSIAAADWERYFPYAIDPPPWLIIAGLGEYNAFVSTSPGSEGSDRHFAEILSKLMPARRVYSLWFGPERQYVFEWEDGREIASREEDPASTAEAFGFIVLRESMPYEMLSSVAVVEGATVDEVRHALGDFADEEWLHIAPGPVGVLITASDGKIGSQAWDVAEVLPKATVYYVQHRLEAFSVLVLRGTDEVGRLRVPILDDDTPMLSNIKGAKAEPAIIEALGIPPDALHRS